MRRRPLRLGHYDYSAAGFYFVTACTRDRACAFGAVVGESMRLSALGAVARDLMCEIPEHHDGVTIDSYVVMPNHVHAIIATPARGGPALGTIVGTYKAAVVRSSRRRGLWQRGYYDHVIRDEEDLARVREYIATNPLRWALDPDNPARLPS